MLKRLSIHFCLGTVALVNIFGCTQNQSNITPIGTYCGKSTEEFKNPLSNQDIDSKVFTVIANPPAEKYKAESVSLLFKKSDSDEQVMFAHRPVYSNDAVSLKSFGKTCARGITPESVGSFEATLPVEITISEDSTWKASQALSYSIEYGKELMDKGFLNGSVEDVSAPAPSEELDFGFSEFLYLNQTGGKLTKAKKALKAKPETAMDEIFMQIKVSESPEIYARITFIKVAKPADDASTANPAAPTTAQ